MTPSGCRSNVEPRSLNPVCAPLRKRENLFSRVSLTIILAYNVNVQRVKVLSLPCCVYSVVARIPNFEEFWNFLVIALRNSTLKNFTSLSAINSFDLLVPLQALAQRTQNTVWERRTLDLDHYSLSEGFSICGCHVSRRCREKCI